MRRVNLDAIIAEANDDALEVSVGGRVVERRTIVGPYGAMWCQG